MESRIAQTEGIVLQSTPYKENDKILSLFSLNLGLIKLYVKPRAKNAYIEQILTAPFTLGEYHYLPGRNDFFFYKEGSIICSYDDLRKHWDYLATAQKLSQLLIASQLSGKPAPQLFQLLALFLDFIPKAENLETLLACFKLKILKHEGLLAFHNCSICNASLQESYRFGGECFCKEHALAASFTLSLEEEKILFFLAHCRSLSEVSNLALPSDFFALIETLFYQSLVY